MTAGQQRLAWALLLVSVVLGGVLVTYEDTLESRRDPVQVLKTGTLTPLTELKWLRAERMRNLERYGLVDDLAVSASAAAEGVLRRENRLAEAIRAMSLDKAQLGFCGNDLPLPFAAVPFLMTGSGADRRVVRVGAVDMLAPDDAALADHKVLVRDLLAEYETGRSGEDVAMALAPLLLGPGAAADALDAVEAKRRKEGGLEELIDRYESLELLLPTYLGRMLAVRELIETRSGEEARDAWPCVVNRD